MKKNEEKEMLIAQAKFTLKQAGYFVDNLWHVDDVKIRYNCSDDDQAQDILDSALTNDATMEQVWFAIDMVAQDEGLKLKEDEDERE
jgi:hypothetical protein